MMKDDDDGDIEEILRVEKYAGGSHICCEMYILGFRDYSRKLTASCIEYDIQNIHSRVSNIQYEQAT